MSHPAISDPKFRAAMAALVELPDSGTIGLGTGSTARLFIALLGERVARGARYVGVPTSEASRVQASSLGIPLVGEEGPFDIDVTVDGADEVSNDLDLIKGGGGAHTREKLVNAASRKNVIIVDEKKRSAQLGERWAVPIEVLQFGHLATKAHLARHGLPTLRMHQGRPSVTDSGNLLYDLQVAPLADPGSLERALRGIPGVVESGLFVSRADVVLVAHEGHVERLSRV